jgi:hypothetical protein
MEVEAAFISRGVFQAMGYFSRIVSLNLLALARVSTAMAASAPLSDPTIIAHSTSALCSSRRTSRLNLMDPPL